MPGPGPAQLHVPSPCLAVPQLGSLGYCSHHGLVLSTLPLGHMGVA